MTDLARLILAKELLAGDVERPIWVDADILVFDPDQFDIAITEEFAFCKEVWIGKSADSQEVLYHRNVNNAATVFLKDNHFLDFYIHACQSIVRSKEGQLKGLEVGTQFLTTLHKVLPFQLLTDVGTLSPTLSAEIAQGDNKVSRFYINEMGSPIRAANLCSSQRNVNHSGVLMDDQMFEAVIDRLVRTEGDVINSQLKTRLSHEILDHSKNLSRLFYEEICNRTSDADDDPEIAIFAWWVCHVAAVSKFGAENIQDELNLAQGMLTKLLATRLVELGLLSDGLDDDEKLTQTEAILHEAADTYAAESQRAVAPNEKWYQIAREFVTRLDPSMNARDAGSLANAMSALASHAFDEVGESLQH